MVAAGLRPTGALPFVGRDPGLVLHSGSSSAASSLARAARAPQDAPNRRSSSSDASAGREAHGGRPRPADPEMQRSTRSSPTLSDPTQQRLPPARRVEAPGARRPVEGVAREGRRPRRGRSSRRGSRRTARSGRRSARFEDGAEKLRRRPGTSSRPSDAARSRTLGRDAATAWSRARRESCRGLRSCVSTGSSRSIVKLPGGENVVVDAKAPLAAYLRRVRGRRRGRAGNRAATHDRRSDHVTQAAAKTSGRTSSRRRRSSRSCSSPRVASTTARARAGRSLTAVRARASRVFPVSPTTFTA